jgi:hypothetical protein
MFKRKPEPTDVFAGMDEDHPNTRFAELAWAPIDPDVPRLIALVAKALVGQIAEPSRVLHCLMALQPVGAILRRDPCECGRPDCEQRVGGLYYSANPIRPGLDVPDDLMVLLYYTYV